jgi:hypothetical protein
MLPVCVCGVGWDWVHWVRWPLIGLLYQPWMIDGYGAFGGMRIGRGNLLQYHFVHHKSRITYPVIEHGPPRWEAGDWPPEPRHELCFLLKISFGWKKPSSDSRYSVCHLCFIPTVFHLHHPSTSYVTIGYYLKHCGSRPNCIYVAPEVLTAVAMKSSIFWNISPYSPLKVNWCFWGTCRFHLQCRGICMKQVVGLLLALFWFLSLLIFGHWGWRWHAPTKRGLTFNRLHGVIPEDRILLSSI